MAATLKAFGELTTNDSGLGQEISRSADIDAAVLLFDVLPDASAIGSGIVLGVFAMSCILGSTTYSTTSA
ncbi:hypothetical protein GQ54DRAFT_314923 [Martensiomyces pterosporus]|nr:hypothetical protein GQ54DRAFT_314923 [Martensiomyces pterosporus]